MESQPISNLFPNNLNAIVHARELATTFVLPAAHNALVPISRLPSEVLARIFLFCAEISPPSMDHGPDEYGSDSNESEEPYKPEPINLGWLQVTHVCKSWRQTALHYPHIWTKIRGLSLPWMQAALARGRSVPISVSFGQFEPIPFKLDCTPTAAHGEEIAKHASRIRDISLWVDTGGLMRILTPMVASPVKALQSLELRNRDGWICLPADMFGASAPALRTVSLCDAIISWSAPILRNLIDLTVILNGVNSDEDDDEDASIPSQFDELLCGLRNMSALQKLDLAGCLPPRSRRSTEDSIDLPMLGTLRLSDYATRCCDFLKCIKISSSCKLSLYEDRGDEGLISELDSLFHEHANREQGPLRSLVLEVDRVTLNKFHVSRMGSDGETELTYALENRYLLQPGQESAPTSLDTTIPWCHKFPIESLRHLHVKLAWCHWFYATPQEWIDTFGRCVALKEVEIHCDQPQTLAFWTAMTMCIPHDGACKDTLFLPNLRHLTMHLPFDSSDDFQESWFKHVDARQKVKPIQTVCYRVGYSKRSKSGDMFVAELEKIVPKVKWCSG